MGMAASQARLLSLTSRLHDVERKAQNIESQKIALATQKDEVYQEYCDALDATKYQVAFLEDGAKTWVQADFKNLCTYQGDSRMRDYALRDNRTGNLIVSEETKNNYDKFKNDKFAFAWAMLGYDNMDGAETVGCHSNTWGLENGGFMLNRGLDSTGTQTNSSTVMTAEEWDVYDSLEGTQKQELKALFEKIETAVNDGDNEARDKAVTAFRNALYEKCGAELYAKLESSTDKTWDQVSAEFSFYCRQFDAISQAGGCSTIDPKFETGDSSAVWIQNMVEAGLITIIENKEPKGATGSWSDTSIATSTNANYLSEVQDEKDLKKAEAKYEHELSIINRKDTKYDTELSKLETERTSITTEMDSIKTVRNDNIDRTFGIFS